MTDDKSLAELNVHFSYMSEHIKGIHDRLDKVPTSGQLAALATEVQSLKGKTDLLQEEVANFSKVRTAGAVIQTLAIWVTAVVAGGAALGVMFKFILTK